MKSHPNQDPLQTTLNQLSERYEAGHLALDEAGIPRHAGDSGPRLSLSARIELLASLPRPRCYRRLAVRH